MIARVPGANRRDRTVTTYAVIMSVGLAIFTAFDAPHDVLGTWCLGCIVMFLTTLVWES